MWPFSFFWTGFKSVEPDPLLETADALTAAINSVTFSQSFTAARHYADLDAQLKSLDLTVDVIPVERIDIQMETRGHERSLCVCDLVLRKQIRADGGGVKLIDVNPLVSLLQAIENWLSGRELAHDCMWQSCVTTAVIHKHLREWNQYTGILRLTYAVSRELSPFPKND